MQVLATALLAPGCCTLCGSAAGPFVDTGRQSAQHGRVYVCQRCSIDTAAAFDETFRRAPAPSEERRHDLEAELVALRERFEALVEAVHLTLTEGVAIRRGKVALRSQRGRKGFELDL